MYALIKTGGKQYKVKERDTIRVEKLPGQEGATLDITSVLMLVDGERIEVGSPFVAGATVQARITAQGRGPKSKVIKFRRRKHYKKQMGHRQSFTELQILGVQAG